MFLYTCLVNSTIFLTSYLPIAFNSLLLDLLDSFTKYFFLLLLNQVYCYLYAVKFLIVLSLLIFIRGGTPRYRLDFLTKLG